jgi:sialidase-1
MHACLMKLTVLVALVALLEVSCQPLHSATEVFSIGEHGYSCIKIPYLLVTRSGVLIALAEARINSCWDWAGTDLVFKRSTDNGSSWSAIGVVYSNSSNVTQEWNTIGNAAPVQLKPSGRILLPFCRNNAEVLQTWSDDDGLTWAQPIAIPQVVRSHWKWVGAGPPGAIQLLSGRIVVPSYHSDVYDTNGEISRSHVMLNDDPSGSADKWRLGGFVPSVARLALFLTNECQAAEIAPDHILLAARGFLPHRIQALSVDGGETFQAPYTISITEPLEGCAGSMISAHNGTLFYSGTVNPDPKRFNMTLWSSIDKGESWQLQQVVDTGRTAYVVGDDDECL